MATFNTIVVNQLGDRFDALPRARVEEINEVFNDIYSATISVPKKYARATVLQLLNREVQIWDESGVAFWGVPTRRGSDEGDRVKFFLKCFPWYLSRRRVGRLYNNMAMNWSFEDPLTEDPFTGWATAGVTAERITSHKFHGDYGLQLSNDTGDTELFANEIIGLGPEAAGQIVTVHCKFHLRADSAYLPFEEAKYGYGVMARLIAPGNVLVRKAGYGISPRFGHQVGENYDAHFHIFVDPGFVGHLEIRLYAPKGDIVYDAVQILLLESLDFQNADYRDIVEGLVEHAQDPDFNKSNEHILVAGNPIGTTTNVTFHYAHKANIWNAIKRYTEFEGGINVYPTYTPSTRTLMVRPWEGDYHPEYKMVWGKNITSYTLDRNGEEVTNTVTSRGEGDAPWQYMAFAQETDALDVVLEDVVDAPEGMGIDWLDDYARGQVQQKKDIVDVLGLTIRDGPTESIRKYLKVGDRIPVQIVDGLDFVDDDYKVISKKIREGSRLIDLTLNRVGVPLT